MPVLRKASAKPFTKVVVSKGYGFHTPQDGSVCKFKVIKDTMHVITGLDDLDQKEIIVGDVDETTDRIIEDCIRTMKEEEECSVKFQHPCLDENLPENVEETKDMEINTVATDGTEPGKEKEVFIQNDFENKEENMKKEKVVDSVDSVQLEQSSQNLSEVNANVPSDYKSVPTNLVEIQFQLVSYTREPEIWEMSITEKWRRASYHKQRGLELYSRGAYQYAFRRFGLTLKYVISLEHDVPSGQEEGMDIKGLKLSCYLNVAACQMRHHNFESVVINSTKALALQPNNAKALYRRGSAYLQLQEYEKSKEDLSAAQQLEPKNQAITKQLQLLKNQVQKLNQYYASAMKKLFS